MYVYSTVLWVASKSRPTHACVSDSIGTLISIKTKMIALGNIMIQWLTDFRVKCHIQ